MKPVGDEPMRSPGECRAWVEANVPMLRRVVRTVCRNGRLSVEDAPDFTGTVMLKLVDRDYAVLRQFDGRSTLTSYLYKVISRQLLDWRNAQWGKWRPSAEARRQGDLAVQLERLTVRDRLPMTEALGQLAARPWTGPTGPDMRTFDGLEAASLHRPRRLREIGIQSTKRHDLPAPDRTDACVERWDLRADAQRVSAALRAALISLDPDERRLLCMRFEHGMSIRAIADEIGVERKWLYRRFATTLRRIRARLRDHQLSRRTVRPLIGHPEVMLAPLLSSSAFPRRAPRRHDRTVVGRVVGHPTGYLDSAACSPPTG